MSAHREEPGAPDTEGAPIASTAGSGGDNQDLGSVLEALLARIRGLTEPAMRASVVAGTLRELSPEAAARMCVHVYRGSVHDPALKDLWHALALAVEFQLVTEDVLAEMRSCLFGLGSEGLATALTPPQRVHRERPPVAVVPGGRQLTLGERKALARKPDRRLLARLARDPDPSVVRIVLSNPRTVEQDVVRIAASRPANRAALLEIARHPRWNNKIAVVRALVFNPATPLAAKLRLLPRLRRQDLREVAFGGLADQETAAAAKRLLDSDTGDEGGRGHGPFDLRRS